MVVIVARVSSKVLPNIPALCHPRPSRFCDFNQVSASSCWEPFVTASTGPWTPVEKFLAPSAISVLSFAPPTVPVWRVFELYRWVHHVSHNLWWLEPRTSCFLGRINTNSARRPSNKARGNYHSAYPRKSSHVNVHCSSLTWTVKSVIITIPTYMSHCSTKASF